jgi:hypothetical protein
MKKISLFILCLFAALALKADITPEPQISYTFKYFTQAPLAINPAFSEQIQCLDNQCYSSEPLGVYGIQKLTCGGEDCYAVAYRFKPFQKLIISFSDGKVRESAVFQAPKALRNTMQVNVYEDGLEVIPLPYAPAKDNVSISYVIVSCATVLILELLAAAVFLIVAEAPLSILIWVAAANIISVPFNWFVLSQITPNNGIIWAVTYIFELLFIYLINRKKLSFKEAAGLVFVANVASYAIGMMAAYMYASR